MQFFLVATDDNSIAFGNTCGRFATILAWWSNSSFSLTNNSICIQGISIHFALMNRNWREWIEGDWILLVLLMPTCRTCYLLQSQWLPPFLISLQQVILYHWLLANWAFVLKSVAAMVLTFTISSPPSEPVLLAPYSKWVASMLFAIMKYLSNRFFKCND